MEVKNISKLDVSKRHRSQIELLRRITSKSCEETVKIWQKDHEDRDGDVSTRMSTENEGLATEMTSEVLSSISSTPHKSHGDDVHKETDETEDAEDVPDFVHRDAVRRGKQCGILILRQNSHVTGNRAHFQQSQR